MNHFYLKWSFGFINIIGCFKGVYYCSGFFLKNVCRRLFTASVPIDCTDFVLLLILLLSNIKFSLFSLLLFFILLIAFWFMSCL
jgi:hypothetical protein